MRHTVRPAWLGLALAGLVLAVTAGCSSGNAEQAERIKKLEQEVAALNQKCDQLSKGEARLTEEQVRSAIKKSQDKLFEDLKARVAKEQPADLSKTEADLKKLKTSLAADLDARPTKKYIDDLLKSRPADKTVADALKKVDALNAEVAKRVTQADVDKAVKKALEAESKARPTDKAVADALKKVQDDLAAGLKARPTQADLDSAVKKAVEADSKARPTEKTTAEAIRKVDDLSAEVKKRVTAADVDAAVKKAIEAENKARLGDKALADAVKKVQDDLAASLKGRLTQAEVDAAVKKALEAESKSRPTEKTAAEAIKKVDDLKAELEKRPTREQVEMVVKAVDSIVNNRVAAALDGPAFKKALELRVQASLPKAVAVPGLFTKGNNYHKFAYDVTAGALKESEPVRVTLKGPGGTTAKVFALSATPSADGKSLVVEAWTTAPWDAGTDTLNVWLPPGVKISDKPRPAGGGYVPVKFGK